MGVRIRLPLFVNNKTKALVTSIPKKKLPKHLRDKLLKMKYADVTLEDFE